MKKEDGTLYHRYKDGEVKYEGTLDDYAFFIWGLIELYETIFEEKYLFEAYGFMNVLFEHFWDKEHGGFFMTPDYITDVVVRPQEVYDGAIPSGNSVSLYNLARLGRLLGITEFENKAKELIKAFSKELSLLPSAHTMLVIGLDLLVNGTKEVVIVSPKEKSEDFIKAVYEEYNPFVLVALKTPDSKLGCISGFINQLQEKDGKPTVYICENFACKPPITSAEQLKAILKE